MKGTYKLVGVFWDGRPEIIRNVAVKPYDMFYLSLSSQPCLFDLIECKRQIKLSQLLQIQNQEEAAVIIEKLVDCKSVAIVADYIPKVKSSVHCRFFEHRLLQVLGYLSTALPETEILLMEPFKTEVAE